MFATQNQAVTNADFSPYCISVPSDPKLPGGGGNQLCGFYDVIPSLAGKFNNVITHASQFGDIQDVYDGIDLSVSARLSSGMVLSGGVSAGRERTNDCAMLNQPSLSPGLVVNGAAGTVSGFVGSVAGVTSPNTTADCNIVPPWQPNAKVLAVYPLPFWDLQASGTFQSVPGPQITASYVATNAQILPSLGRNLAGAPGSVLLDVVPPGTMYADRLYQTDVRVSKLLRIGRGRLRAQIDLYNLLNSAAPLTVQARYGSLWQTPTRTLIGRLAKFGAQFDF
jgi:hypothetical protein